MFTQTWNKYLPLIRIFMKRSTASPQTLAMNFTDFQRATGGRKVKFTFSISLHKGRIQNTISPSPLAKELSALLQQDDITRQLVRQYDYDFSLNSDFQLTIKNNTPQAAAEKTDAEKQTEMDAAEENDNAAN
jgi:hypothetical protein